jgi:hypothetical protein
MSYAASDSLPGVVQNDFLCARMIRKFSLDNNAKPTKLKKNVWPLLTMNMDGLCIRCDTEP